MNEKNEEIVGADAGNVNKDDKLWAISIITGQIFPIQKEDVPLLFQYQIPLKALPKSNCKKCHSRGWTHLTENKLHSICPCLAKRFMDGYIPQELSIPLPRMV